MRRTRMALAALMALFLLGAACTTDEGDGGDGGDGGANQAENTGTVNVLNAMEPHEAEAVQAAVDENIGEVDYTVEIEASADFEEQFPIRAEGGTLDVALVPQPGTVATQAAAGTIVSLEDMGFDVAAARGDGRRVPDVARRVRGRALGGADQRQPEVDDLVPEGRLRRGRIQVPDNVGRADGPVRPDRSRTGTRRGASGSSPAAPPDGRRPTGWKTSCSGRPGPDVYDQWVTHEIPFNDPAVATAAETFGDVMFTEGYVLGGAADTPSIAFGAAPLPMFDDPPKCWLHRQASFIIGAAPFPEDAESGRGLRLVPVPADRPGGNAPGRRVRGRGHQREPSRGDGLPREVPERAGPVRPGRRSALVAGLAEHRRRARTATRTRSWPTRRRSSRRPCRAGRAGSTPRT